MANFNWTGTMYQGAKVEDEGPQDLQAVKVPTGTRTILRNNLLIEKFMDGIRGLWQRLRPTPS